MFCHNWNKHEKASLIHLFWKKTMILDMILTKKKTSSKFEKKNDFNNYFNFTKFNDFVFIKNKWQAFKQNLRKILIWDDETTKEIIIKKWSHLSQKRINKLVDLMSQRLQNVLKGEKAMTRHWIVSKCPNALWITWKIEVMHWWT